MQSVEGYVYYEHLLSLFSEDKKPLLAAVGRHPQTVSRRSSVPSNFSSAVGVEGS